MKKLKVGMTVRHENGKVGEIIEFDNNHPVFNVKVRFQDETQHLWVAIRRLKVHKEALEYKRGDLVVYEDKVSIVLGGVCGNRVYIATLEGTYRTMWAKDTEMQYASSLKKKIGRIKQRYQGDTK